MSLGVDNAAQGRLEVVATPIGNLGDASPRMREALAAADLVVAEDTRRTGRLLTQFGVDRPLFALHDHNEAEVVPGLVARMRDGARLALVSDAGTPAISDPGFRLIRAALAEGLRVSPIPGAVALIAALSVSGLPTDRFAFEGFPPAKAKARLASFQALADEPRTLVFYEAVHRIEASLRDAVTAFGAERPAFLARELTKMHEQCVSDSLGGLLEAVATGRVTAKGEFVLAVAGNPTAGDAEHVQVGASELMRRLLAAGLSRGDAARLVAGVSGLSRNDLYAATVDD
ncbi:MAG: 16S rRNA (cytidine(1402)-2'-O)-methyltransferase [Pseudomonadota bacterium]